MKASFGTVRETSYSREQEDKKERKQERSARRQPLVLAAQLLSAGGKLNCLSPEQLAELEKAVGNQIILELMKGQGNESLLTELPECSSAAKELPENPVEIRWPALWSVPGDVPEKTGQSPVWALESLRGIGGEKDGR